MESQITLTGEKARTTPPAGSIPVRAEYRLAFSLQDSIWQTLKFFYQHEQELGCPELKKLHISKYPISHNSIINNIQRLEDMGWIILVRDNAGKTRSKKLFAMTPGGRTMYEEFEEVKKESEEADLLKLYIFKDKKTDFIKIGSTFNVENRKKSLENQSPLFLETIMVLKGINRIFEKEVHEKFKDFRVKGEWYTGDCMTEVIEFINNKGAFTI